MSKNRLIDTPSNPLRPTTAFARSDADHEDEVAALTDAAAAGVGFTTHEFGAVPGGGGGLPPFLDYPHTAMPAAAPTGYPVGYYPGQTTA